MRLINDLVRKEIESLIVSLGFVLIEVWVARRKGSSIVHIVIYRQAGVGIDDCASVSRMIYPKLELLPDLGPFSLQVSSPGIGRELKNRAEFNIFQGQGLAVLLANKSEWEKGIIDHTDAKSLFLKIEGVVVELAFDQIKRGKLAFVEEERTHVL